MIERLLGKLFPRMLTVEVMAFILLAAALRAFTHGVTSSVQNMDASQSGIMDFKM